MTCPTSQATPREEHYFIFGDFSVNDKSFGSAESRSSEAGNKDDKIKIKI